VYETLASGSPTNMVPAIRNILGGFLFSGDDVYKRVRVLSGGERTRLAVARMLLRPSNTLLLDEPTNHLDLDSKEVLLDALTAYGGTLIFVSHDRYFVERLATKIIEVGQGTALVYPGTYTEFLWHKDHPDRPVDTPAATHRPAKPDGGRGLRTRTAEPGPPVRPPRDQPAPSRDERKRADADARRRARAEGARRSEIDRLEARIAETERAIRDVEQTMAAPGFYADRAAAQPVIDRHQALMWQVGDLMHQWEQLQHASELAQAPKG
jgi:ATP-binding cassette subfamily F protein 3